MKKLDDHKVVTVGISRWPASWHSGFNLKYVAPSEDLLRRYKSGVTDKEGYIREFKQMLETRDRERFVYNLKKIVEMYDGYESVALVCFERPGQFCHRHLVAEWLEEGGYMVEEFDA